MTPEDFLKTVYLGDRICKGFEIDSWNQRVILKIDKISRIRSASGEWEYYTEEDIEDGLIVFDSVSYVKLSPSAFLPNDWVSFISVVPAKSTGPDKSFKFSLSLGSVSDEGNGNELNLEVIASGVHLENPAQKGVSITE